MLTLEQLKEMEPDTVFASGIAPNHPYGIYMTNENLGRELLWVAVRGGWHDWVIVTHWKEQGEYFVKTQGDKVVNPETIRRLVPCTDQAFSYYRF